MSTPTDDLFGPPFEVELAGEPKTRWEEEFQAARDAYIARNLDGAITLLSTAYERLVARQPAGRRFHKGFALHQLGLWELERKNAERAFGYFLNAFVEDALTRGEKEPRNWDELGYPAAQTLVFSFSFAGVALLDLSRRLREVEASGRSFRTPERALQQVPVLTPATTGAQVEAQRLVQSDDEPFAPVWRELGDFGTPIGRRVFVGGSYAHPYLERALRAARDQARACGWDGVVVGEFLAPALMDTRTKSLICLMGCRRAIFDLSESGGHQVEFDKLVDFGIRKVLVVYDAEANDHLKISSLTRAWFPALKVAPKGYRGIPQLKEFIRQWLPCESDRNDQSGSGADLEQRAARLAAIRDALDEEIERLHPR